MKQAVITGSAGQDGFYLRQLLEAQGFNVVGFGRGSGPVAEFIQEWKPAYVFHLAAASHTDHCFTIEHHATIGAGTLEILEAVRLHAPETRVFIAGSGLQFVNHGMPIQEGDAWDCSSSYAVVRNYALGLCRYYRRAFNLKIYNGFLFNHESPRRAPRHVSQMIAAAARGLRPVNIQDLAYQKEWTFAGDIVAALWLLVNQDQVWEANLGSGQAWSIATWANFCYGAVGLNYLNYVTDLQQPGPHARLVCDPGRLQALGWKPQVSLPELAQMMVQEGTLKT